MSSKQTNERRHYFRIEDRVQLRHRVLSPDALELRLHATEESEGSVALSTQFRELSAQMGKVLASIRKSNPDIALYLNLLDRKIEILSRQLELSGGEAVSADTQVSLSGGGLGFRSSEAIPADSGLEIEMVLFPSLQRIQALGRVESCEEDPQGPPGRTWRIGVEFVRIAEADQDALLRHLIERQSAQLRRQREH